MPVPKPTRALYKYPGPFEFQDGKYDYLVVLEDEKADHLKNGWHLTLAEARAAAKPAAKPTVTKPVVK